MAEDIVVSVANEMAIEQTKVLLRALASHFSDKTKLISVPVGTQRYSVVDIKGKTVIIELHQFFGMYVGYDAKLDILACWSPLR